MIELQMTILFVLAMFFSVIYEMILSWYGARNALAWGVLSSVCWIIFAVSWAYSGSLIFVAYLPLAIGIFYAARVFENLQDMLKSRRRFD